MAYPSCVENGDSIIARIRRPHLIPSPTFGYSSTDFHLWPVAALALVVDPASQTRIDPVVAAAALGLTGMESRVAVLLAEGMNVREIAVATGRGESTIRSHVKHIFAKHGLSRQAELVRLVLSLAAAPTPRRWALSR